MGSRSAPLEVVAYLKFGLSVFSSLQVGSLSAHFLDLLLQLCSLGLLALPARAAANDATAASPSRASTTYIDI